MQMYYVDSVIVHGKSEVAHGYTTLGLLLVPDSMVDSLAYLDSELSSLSLATGFVSQLCKLNRKASNEIDLQIKREVEMQRQELDKRFDRLYNRYLELLGGGKALAYSVRNGIYCIGQVLERIPEEAVETDSLLEQLQRT